MTSRFASNLIVLVLAGVTIAGCFGFAAGTAAWLGFSLACVAVTLALVGFALRGRGAAQRALDALVAVIGGWTIVATRVFDASTARWLGFAGAAAFAALAVIGLVANEVAHGQDRASRPREDAVPGHTNGHKPSVPSAGAPR